jgi:copper chaperone CopZ
VREALMACEGVKDAKVDFAAKTATVIVSEESANADELTAAVNAAGFSGTTVK